VKYWEIIADNLSKAGWSLGWVAALDCEGQTIWIADAHRDDGKRYVVHADEKLTAFLELEAGTRVVQAVAARMLMVANLAKKQQNGEWGLNRGPRVDVH
jgi:hypothetical protein